MNSIKSGTIVDESKCILCVDPEFEYIGLTAGDIRNLDFVFYRILGWGWEESDKKVTMRNLYNNKEITVTGSDFNAFFQAKDNESYIYDFFIELKQMYKENK